MKLLSDVILILVPTGNGECRRKYCYQKVFLKVQKSLNNFSYFYLLL